ncbi:DUF72 domain-containing protein [Deminuibacter soli]|uniref:DUF72 domain-containing protein n=1 Tax=Deminuibacter soli TaxID=2291815 RepID=A0A3E1NIR7_9BACT|nr:DUF72 domain-containing protein [Deminuibacter soli]RFM27812.1 DUF72 domain-containing protein [Deminuibacter soli]
MSDTLFYCGLSGLVLPVPNKQAFPEAFREASRLQYYASLFNSIEVNSSFYKVPMPATFRKWSLDVPDDFVFTVKLNRDITHAKALAYKEADVTRFMQAANETGNKKGCLLVQFPASITDEYYEEVDLLLHRLQQHNQTGKPWQIAVEFRNSRWYNKQVYAMLDEHKACMVLHDMSNSATAVLNKKAGVAYFRFHGPEKGYRGSYSNDVLKRYAALIQQQLLRGRQVFAYFNNTLGDAIGNLYTLRDMVAAD